MSMIAIGLNKNFLPLLRNTSWSFVFYIAVAALVVRVTYAFIEWQKQCQSVSHLPGYSFGFMGQIPSIVKNFDHLYDWESSNFNKYGPTFKMTGPLYVFFLCHIQYTKQSNYVTELVYFSVFAVSFSSLYCCINPTSSMSTLNVLISHADVFFHVHIYVYIYVKLEYSTNLDQGFTQH